MYSKRRKAFKIIKIYALCLKNLTVKDNENLVKKRKNKQKKKKKLQKKKKKLKNT
jgi:hypothetical protein